MIELNTIYNEDCLEGMKRIPDASVDCIICDLPYGTTHNPWDTIIPFDLLWEQYRRIIKPNGAIVLFGSEPFSTTLRMSNLKEFRYDWIWEKSRKTDFLNAKMRPIKKHEVISVFSKEKPNYYPQGLIKCNKKMSNFSTNKFGRNSRDWDKAETYVQEYENYPTSVLHFNNEPTNVHPTQKPVALIGYLIKTYTNEGETILDNCMGSGTTAIAAIRTKRNYIGFELQKEYFDIACERIKKEQQQLSLF